MNYLAHAYLSFELPDILVGNMISDYIKGKKQFDYPVAIQNGIRLHRAIDTFTDSHKATAELKTFFRPQYRLYSGAFADIVYDHFLANDTNEFSTETGLNEFAENTYKILDAGSGFFPEPFRKMFPYMKAHDWLSNYKFRWAIEKSFNGLIHRSAYLAETKIAFEIFNEHYDSMKNCYADFFPDLKKFTSTHLYEVLQN